MPVKPPTERCIFKIRSLSERKVLESLFPVLTFFTGELDNLQPGRFRGFGDNSFVVDAFEVGVIALELDPH
jgi:hypothetical protein